MAYKSATEKYAMLESHINATLDNPNKLCTKERAEALGCSCSYASNSKLIVRENELTSNINIWYEQYSIASYTWGPYPTSSSTGTLKINLSMTPTDSTVAANWTTTSKINNSDMSTSDKFLFRNISSDYYLIISCYNSNFEDVSDDNTDYTSNIINVILFNGPTHSIITSEITVSGIPYGTEYITINEINMPWTTSTSYTPTVNSKVSYFYGEILNEEFIAVPNNSTTVTNYDIKVMARRVKPMETSTNQRIYIITTPSSSSDTLIGTYKGLNISDTFGSNPSKKYYILSGNTDFTLCTFTGSTLGHVNKTGPTYLSSGNSYSIAYCEVEMSGGSFDILGNSEYHDYKPITPWTEINTFSYNSSTYNYTVYWE